MRLFDLLREKLRLGEETYEDELSPFSNTDVDLSAEQDGDDSKVEDRRG